MIQYMTFITKRLLQRKSNVMLMLCSITVLLFVLIMNMRTQRLYDNIESQIVLLNDAIEEYEKKLPTLNEGDMEYILASETLHHHKEELNLYEQLKNYYLAKEWDLFYTTYETVKKNAIAIMEHTMLTSENKSSLTHEIYNSELKELQYAQYLQEHQLSYEDRSYPIYGLTFMTYASEFVAPILILLCCVYMMAQAFTLDYAKGIDVSRLLPIGRIAIFRTKLWMGIGSSLIVFFIITGSAFFLATILNFNAGLHYPFIELGSQGDFVSAPMMNDLLKWLVLGLSFYLCVSIFVLTLSLWIKEDITLFITTLCIVLGLAYLPIFLPAIKEIIHLFPTTYLNYTSVALGNLASQYENTNLSFSFGMMVLSISSAIMIVIGYFKSYR